MRTQKCNSQETLERSIQRTKIKHNKYCTNVKLGFNVSSFLHISFRRVSHVFSSEGNNLI